MTKDDALLMIRKEVGKDTEPTLKEVRDTALGVVHKLDPWDRRDFKEIVNRLEGCSETAEGLRRALATLLILYHDPHRTTCPNCGEILGLVHDCEVSGLLKLAGVAQPGRAADL